jgi:isoleucyl-tRNA synthetase
VVSFPLKSEPDTALLAWTTTPWLDYLLLPSCHPSSSIIVILIATDDLNRTLPSNLALCVNPKLKYVKVLDKSSGAKWILAESRLVQLFPTSADAKDAHATSSSSESADGIVKDALISFDDEPEDKPRVGKVHIATPSLPCSAVIISHAHLCLYYPRIEI